jgi:predicted DNA-binding transcriptional regulator AlpA
LSDATLKRLEIAGDFPARRLVAGRRVAWLASEVTEWMRTRTKVVLQTASSTGRVSD